MVAAYAGLSDCKPICNDRSFLQADSLAVFRPQENTLPTQSGRDLPPLSRTKSMEQSPLILENGGYEDHTIYRRADHRIP